MYFFQHHAGPMKSPALCFRYGILGLLLCSARIGTCDEQFLRPFLDSSTFCVARLDLAKLETEPFVVWGSKNFPKTLRLDPIEMIRPVLDKVKSLKSSGVTEAYVIVSTDVIWDGVVTLIVPSDSPKNLTDQLSKAIESNENACQAYAADHAVVITSPTVWQRMSQDTLTAEEPRDDLIDALSIDVPGHQRIALSLRSDLHREVANMLPDHLTGPWKTEVPLQHLWHGVRNVTIGVNVDGAPQLHARFNGGKGQQKANYSRILRLVKDLKLSANPESLVKQSDDAVDVAATQKQINEILNQSKYAEEMLHRQAMNHLRYIGLAMHNFHDKHKYLPPRATRSQDARHMLSWRVFLLPFLGEAQLYKKFRLDEPWDSVHNEKLIKEIPDVFQLPDAGSLPEGHTRYVLPVMREGLWASTGPPAKFSDVIDGTSNTIAAVVGPADKSVIWTRPQELWVNPNSPGDNLFGDREYCQVLLLDGSSRRIHRSTAAKVLAALLTHAGKEVITVEDIK